MDELKKLGVSDEMIQRILKNFSITRIAEVIAMYHDEGGETAGFIVHALKHNRLPKQDKMAPQAYNAVVDDSEKMKKIEEMHKQAWLERVESYKSP